MARLLVWSCQVQIGKALADTVLAPPRRTAMTLWVVIITMAAVGGFWVKTRRNRKNRANTYVPN